MIITTKGHLPEHISSRLNELFEDNITLDKVFEILDIDSTFNNEFDKFLLTSMNDKMLKMIDEIVEMERIDYKQLQIADKSYADSYDYSQDILARCSNDLRVEFNENVGMFYAFVEAQVKELFINMFEKTDEFSVLLDTAATAIDNSSKSDSFQSHLESSLNIFLQLMTDSLKAAIPDI